MSDPKIPAPEPCGYAHRYSPRGLLHALRDNRKDAEDDAAIVGGSAHVVTLYDDSALETYAAAREAAARMEERERCAAEIRAAMPNPVVNWSDAQIVEALRNVLERVVDPAIRAG